MKIVRIKVWFVSYSSKDGPFFTEQAAIQFNGSLHGGWGEITESVVEAQLAEAP